MATKSGSGKGQKYQNNNPGKETPEKFDRPAGVGGSEGSGKYPNYWSYKSRSGHSLVFDDSKGEETVSLQHRSGSAIQMMPDGALHITAHNSKYTATFGEDRLVISGAHDIVVKGDASLRVYGDYNVTCHKDYNLTVMGDFNVTAKNHNRLVRGNIDTIAKNETKKLEGSSSGTYLGGYARTAKDAVSVISHSNQSYIGGGAGSHVATTNEGPMTFSNEKGDTVHENKDGKRAVNVESDNKKVYTVADGGKYSVSADEDTNLETKKKMKIKATQEVGVEGQKVQVASQAGGTEVKSQGDVHVNAQGNAGLEGAQTHVGRTAGTTHIVGSTTHVDGTGTLNLNGGGGQAFNGQFAFNFGNLMDQIPKPDISGSGAQPSKSEPEADTWTKRLA